MAGDRRQAKAPSEPGKPCKHCQTPTYTGADGKLAHDRRAAEAPPKEKPGDQKPPKREHFMHRAVGGGDSR